MKYSPLYSALRAWNFDAWRELSEKNPQSFERMRLAAIEEFLQTLPESRRDRLRHFQWRIDQERRRSDHPMGVCVRLMSMMWQQVLGPRGLQQRQQQLVFLMEEIKRGGQGTKSVGISRDKAKILSFVPNSD